MIQIANCTKPYHITLLKQLLSIENTVLAPNIQGVKEHRNFRLHFQISIMNANLIFSACFSKGELCFSILLKNYIISEIISKPNLPDM